jgi:hypothetical protein
MKIIMPETAHQKIRDTHGKLFTVVFRRKNDKVEKDAETGERKIVAHAGDLRQMNCRTEASAKRTTEEGEGKKYSFSAHELVSVYDMHKKGFRSFAWKNVVLLKAFGEEYVVLSEQTKAYCNENPDSDIAKKVEKSGIEF